MEELSKLLHDFLDQKGLKAWKISQGLEPNPFIFKGKQIIGNRTVGVLATWKPTANQFGRKCEELTPKQMLIFHGFFAIQ